MSLSLLDLDSEPIAAAWRELRELGDVVSRNGLDRGKLLGAAGHEIRGMDCRQLEGTEYLAVAGDKLGSWYLATFDAAANAEKPPVWRRLPPLGSDPEKRRVIDAVHILPEKHGVVVGTRGDGVWKAPLDHVLDPSWDGQDGLIPLPHSASKSVQRMLFDSATATLFAVAGKSLLEWQFTGGEAPSESRVCELPSRLTTLTIDRSPEEGDSTRDLLYVATADFKIFTLRRTARDGRFQVDPKRLRKQDPVWVGRLSPVEHLLPLSDLRQYTNGSWKRRYRQRGVIAASLHHLIILYRDDDDPSGQPDRSHVRIITSKSKILTMGGLTLPDWQGVAVSTLNGRLRILHLSGLRRPYMDNSLENYEAAPEHSLPEGILSGSEDVEPGVLPDRVYSLRTLAPFYSKADGVPRLPILLGLGNNELRLYSYKSFWRLRGQALETADAFVDNCLERTVTPTAEHPDNLAALLRDLSDLVMTPTEPDLDKNAVVHLVRPLGKRCNTNQHWRLLAILIWHTLAYSRDASLPRTMLQSLRGLQIDRPDREYEIDKQIIRIRKFILDPGSFSHKETNLMRLANSKDPDLADDRIVYRSILITRGYDPFFIKRLKAGEFSDIQTLTPILPEEEIHRSKPSDPYLLATTYSETLWLLSRTGDACKVDLAEVKLGHVRAAQPSGDRIFLSFSSGQLRYLMVDDLKHAWKTHSDHLTLPKLPGIDEAIIDASALATNIHRSQLIWGDDAGKVFVFAYGQNTARQLLSLHEDLREPLKGTKSPISVIKYIPESRRDQQHSRLVLGTDTGYILLLSWTDSRIYTSEPLRIGNHPITSIVVTGPQERHIVAASSDGTVAGIRIIEKGRQLATHWAFHANAVVTALRAAGNLLLIASHDESIYTLDHEGHHISTCRTAGLRMTHFVARPATKSLPSIRTEVYACALGDIFLGFRLLDRSIVERRLAKDVRQLPDDVREESLARWRAYHIEEGHLRQTFIMWSQFYPGATFEDALQTIRKMLKSSHASDHSTDELIALLNRLLGYSTDAKSGTETGRQLPEVLITRNKYTQFIDLITEIEEMWGTRTSPYQRRLQRTWLRTFLQRIDSLDVLRQWLSLADCEDYGPRYLLQHFLQDTDRFVQSSTLDYIERLLFGWDAYEHPGLLSDTKSEISRERDLNWIVSCLLSRLQRWSTEVNRRETDSIVLKICRLLALLVDARQISALYISFLFQQHRVLDQVYTTFAAVCLATVADYESRASDSPGHSSHLLTRGAEVMRRSLDLDIELRYEGGDLATIAAAIRDLLDFSTRQQHSEPDAEYLHQFTVYHEILVPFLEVDSFDSMQSLQAPDQDQALRYFPTLDCLKALRPFLDAARDYWSSKNLDTYIDPFRALSYEGFHSLQKKWEEVADIFSRETPEMSSRERALILRVRDLWEEIVEKEKNHSLLDDFQIALKNSMFTNQPKIPRDNADSIRLLEEEAEFAQIAYNNLFIRLLLFAEPARAAFLFVNSKLQIEGKIFSMRDGTPELNVLEANKVPAWLNSDWTKTEVFLSLEDDSVQAWIKDLDEIWEYRLIQGAGDDFQNIGIFIFNWHWDSDGFNLFFDHQFAWEVPLQALVFRQSAIQHQAMKGKLFSIIAHNMGTPIFHIRSDLGILVDGRMENEKAKRMEKYNELLRQARHLDGIVDGVLNLTDKGRELQLEIEEVSALSLVNDIVKAARKEAKRVRGVDIDFIKPQEDEKCLIHTDEMKLYDALMNVVTNAVKYSPDDERVKVELTSSPKGINVTVSDRGPGIPLVEQQRIWEPFFRGAYSSAHDIPGLGLGLHITKLYIDALGGRINLRSLGRGSAFAIYIPSLKEPSSN